MRALALQDYTDRELLLMVLDNGDAEGWVTSETLADVLGIEHKHPRQCVGSRMSWMRRYGVVERHPVYDRHAWRLTSIGEVLAKGKLSPAQERQLEHLRDDQMLLVTRWLGARQRSAQDSAGILMRREWRASTFNGR